MPKIISLTEQDVRNMVAKCVARITEERKLNESINKVSGRLLREFESDEITDMTSEDSFGDMYSEDEDTFVHGIPEFNGDAEVEQEIMGADEPEDEDYYY